LANGNYETIDGPGASLTVPYRSNNRGQVVGGYLDSGGKIRGLLRDAKGAFTTFLAPQAASQTTASSAHHCSAPRCGGPHRGDRARPALRLSDQSASPCAPNLL
jgi:hypothetical protein